MLCTDPAFQHQTVILFEIQGKKKKKKKKNPPSHLLFLTPPFFFFFSGSQNYFVCIIWHSLTTHLTSFDVCFAS